MESPGTGNKSDLFLSVDIDQPVAECLRIGDAALSALVSAEILRFSSPFQSTSGIKASRTKRIIKKKERGKKKKSLLEVIIPSKNAYEKSSLRVSEQHIFLGIHCEWNWIFKFLGKNLGGKNRSKRKEKLKIQRIIRNFTIDSNINKCTNLWFLIRNFRTRSFEETFR